MVGPRCNLVYVHAYTNLFTKGHHIKRLVQTFVNSQAVSFLFLAITGLFVAYLYTISLFQWSKMSNPYADKGYGYDQPVTPMMNVQNSTTVVQQPMVSGGGTNIVMVQQQLRPASYIGLSIFTCLCCNPLFGEFRFNGDVQYCYLLKLHTRIVFV